MLFVFIGIANALLIATGILSHPKNFERRQAMRKSWLEPPYRFIIGRCGNERIDGLVQQEMGIYGDILFLPDHPETYRNLTYKTMAMIKWAASVPKVGGLLKADDDTWINMSKLRHRLSLKSIARLYMGIMYWDGAPVREPKHRHYLSANIYAKETFPPFALGWGYFLGADLLREIQPNGLILPLEDISVGLWLEQMEEVEFDDFPVEENWILHHLSARQIALAGNSLSLKYFQ